MGSAAAGRYEDPVLNASPVQKAVELRHRILTGTRTTVGITGAPGAGKSTFADSLLKLLGPEQSVVVPMDGFHLGSAVLTRAGLVERKGAIETFDVGGYVSLLQRLARPTAPVVYAPDFNRDLEEPIAASIAIPRDVPLVITEGNYLLADEPGWREVRECLDEVWYLESADDLRRNRLIERHIRFGKDPSSAAHWAHGSDQQNTELVNATRHKADKIISWS